jgi:hypothetical protein
MPFINQMRDGVYGVLMGIGLKWMLGSDDLVWLSPFMAKGDVRHKLRMSGKYIVSVLFLSTLAIFLAWCINRAAHSSGGSQRIAEHAIGTVGGLLLAAYSFHMAREEGYFKRCGGPSGDDDDDDDDDGDEEMDEKGGAYGALAVEDGGAAAEEESGAVTAALTTGLEGLSACMDAACFCCPADADAEEPTKKSKKAQQDIIVVAFLGSMDDFMVYFSLALSNRITPVELLIGVLIGAVLIALTVGTLLEASETLANFVESIPVPLVIFLLAIYITTSAWVPGLA